MEKKRPVGVSILGWLIILLSVFSFFISFNLRLVPAGEYGSYENDKYVLILALIGGVSLLLLGIGILKRKRLAWIVMVLLSPLLNCVFVGIIWIFVGFLFSDYIKGGESLPVLLWFFMEGVLLFYLYNPQIKEQYNIAGDSSKRKQYLKIALDSSNDEGQAIIGGELRKMLRKIPVFSVLISGSTMYSLLYIRYIFSDFLVRIILLQVVLCCGFIVGNIINIIWFKGDKVLKAGIGLVICIPPVLWAFFTLIFMD